YFSAIDNVVLSNLYCSKRDIAPCNLAETSLSLLYLSTIDNAVLSNLYCSKRDIAPCNLAEISLSLLYLSTIDNAVLSNLYCSVPSKYLSKTLNICLVSSIALSSTSTLLYFFTAVRN